MSNAFENIVNNENLLKARLLFIASFVSCIIFYFLMPDIAGGVDWAAGRIVVSVISITGFIITFKSKALNKWIRITYNAGIYSYLTVYIYLLVLNDWEIFYRWAYFVMVAIVATTVLYLVDYFFFFALFLLAPVIAGFFSPLSPIEQIHFHLTNMATLFIIGVSVRSNFRYRDEALKLTKGLVQSSKMAALGEMSAGVAHEINNPLTIVMANSYAADLLLSSEDVDKLKVQAHLKNIDESAERIARIVQGLLSFSRQENSSHFQLCDIRQIITESIDLCFQRFKTLGVTLTYTPHSTPIMCYCQKHQIIQILLNLLNNAFDACKENSAAPEIQISVLTENNSIYVSVIDNGPGVPSEIENKIMQPFFTTKETGKGTGLGLSISLGLANSNEGHLYLNRAVSPSCFTLQLPQPKA